MTNLLRRFNPATGDVFETIEADDAAVVAAKVAAARAAQPAWAATPYAVRAAAITKFARLLETRKEALAKAQTRETGKPIDQARGEIGATPSRVQWFLDQTEAIIAPSERVLDSATNERVTYAPLGVIGNISAWNYPWFVGTNVYIPALLAGNAVIYKPSEHALDTGRAMGALLHEAGIPQDVFQVVVGAGAAGQALLAQRLDGVFFTGSHSTGVKIAQAAAAQLIPVQLELGGKDPVYVTDGVDPVSTAQGLAEGAFYNNGQSCCAIERIYVHHSLYDAFVAAYVEAVEGYQMGPPEQDDTFLGPLTREAQLAELQAQVDDALDLGANLLTGGKRADRPGYYYEPTVLTDVSHRMTVMREESFGPVIGIQRITNDAEAVALMNDTAYGLTAAVYCPDEARATGILAQLDTGTAYWNCCDRVSPRLPWTGRGHSGVGSTLGEIGIRAFVHPRGWHLRAPK
jgi:acyl-CoA reductase-like NAD-dependent aldehyde dehydrogenase